MTKWIIGTEYYFHQDINRRKSCSKKLSKYVTAFDYISNILTVLCATSTGVCIISSASVVGAPIGIASVSFTLIFSQTTWIIKKLLSITRNKKKKYAKILMLTKRKLDSIETLVSQGLIDMETSHEQFNEIIREKKDMRGCGRVRGKFMFYIVGSAFLTIHFKHIHFIEWFDLNSNPKSLFEKLSVSRFLVDCLLCIRIWIISL